MGFSISNQKDLFIKEVWGFVGGASDWALSWRKLFFGWEEELLGKLMSLLDLLTTGGFRRLQAMMSTL